MERLDWIPQSVFIILLVILIWPFNRASRSGRIRFLLSEEHAEADIQISDHASIASEGICQQNVTKLPILLKLSFRSSSLFPA
jgi:hypothetical protein